MPTPQLTSKLTFCLGIIHLCCTPNVGYSSLLLLILLAGVQLDMAQPYFRLMANEFALSSQQDLVFLQFLVGIFGPTIASWGVLFWAVVTQSFALPTKAHGG